MESVFHYFWPQLSSTIIDNWCKKIKSAAFRDNLGELWNSSPSPSPLNVPEPRAEQLALKSTSSIQQPSFNGRSALPCPILLSCMYVLILLQCDKRNGNKYQSFLGGKKCTRHQRFQFHAPFPSKISKLLACTKVCYTTSFIRRCDTNRWKAIVI